jgi:hypothetical protein
MVERVASARSRLAWLPPALFPPALFPPALFPPTLFPPTWLPPTWLPPLGGRKAPTLCRCLLMTGILAANPAVHAEILDRILAVVDRTIIMQSDVLAAMRLGIPSFDTPRATLSDVRESQGGPASVPQALDTLIERRLMLNEVDRYAPPVPPDAEVDKALASVRARFRSDAEFTSVLDWFGLSREELRRNVRDDLRIDLYLQERFGAAIPPSEEDILLSYQARTAEFARGGVARSFADAHDDVRDALIAARRRDQIRAWVAGLRRRADIIIPADVVR